MNGKKSFYENTFNMMIFSYIPVYLWWHLNLNELTILYLLAHTCLTYHLPPHLIPHNIMSLTLTPINIIFLPSFPISPHYPLLSSPSSLNLSLFLCPSLSYSLPSQNNGVQKATPRTSNLNRKENSYFQ